jgi:hypothetical protein
VSPRTAPAPATRSWLQRFGAVTFALFLLKGIAWLTVPFVLGWLAK